MLLYEILQALFQSTLPMQGATAKSGKENRYLPDMGILLKYVPVKK